MVKYTVQSLVYECISEVGRFQYLSDVLNLCCVYISVCFKIRILGYCFIFVTIVTSLSPFRMIPTKSDKIHYIRVLLLLLLPLLLIDQLVDNQSKHKFKHTRTQIT